MGLELSILPFNIKIKARSSGVYLLPYPLKSIQPIKANRTSETNSRQSSHTQYLANSQYLRVKMCKLFCEKRLVVFLELGLVCCHPEINYPMAHGSNPILGDRMVSVPGRSASLQVSLFDVAFIAFNAFYGPRNHQPCARSCWTAPNTRAHHNVAV